MHGSEEPLYCLANWLPTYSHQPEKLYLGLFVMQQWITGTEWPILLVRSWQKLSFSWLMQTSMIDLPHWNSCHAEGGRGTRLKRTWWVRATMSSFRGNLVVTDCLSLFLHDSYLKIRKTQGWIPRQACFPKSPLYQICQEICQVGIKLDANFYGSVAYILSFIHALTFPDPVLHSSSLCPAQNPFHCFAKLLSAKC